MNELRRELNRAAQIIADYRERLQGARVAPVEGRADVRRNFGGELADAPTPLPQVVDELVAAATPGLMASAGPRYFGFVIGGSLDAALVADVLTSGWDQNAFNEAISPAAIAAEDVAGGWLKELLGLPATASVGFVTGAQGANSVGLAAARWWVLHQAGWDVGRNGLFGAPRVRVLAGAERHATIDRTIRFLGLGEDAIEEVPALPNGAMDTDALALALSRGAGAPTIVCAQAGNVNTGACDDLSAAADAARAAKAWLHVDGAFGLWAAASPRTRHLVDGIERADSWACDGHKWLNVPYDCGLRDLSRTRTFTRRPWRTRRRTSRGRWRVASSAAATSWPSPRAARAASRPGRRSGHSAAPAWLISSTARVRSPGGSPTG